MTAFPKHPPERDSAYLAWIRGMPCAWCGEDQDTRTEASHHPRPGHGSLSRKCSDYRTVALCTDCHRKHHAFRLFDRLWVEEQITGLLIRWIGRLTCK